MSWLPTANCPLLLQCCTVNVEEEDGEQQRLSVTAVDNREEAEDTVGIYANVSTSGRQLLHTDPEAPRTENAYMNVTEAKVGRNQS